LCVKNIIILNSYAVKFHFEIIPETHGKKILTNIVFFGQNPLPRRAMLL